MSSNSLSASSISAYRPRASASVSRLGAGEEALDEQVVLEQAAPAAPAQLAQRARVDRALCGDALGVRGRGFHQTARLTISSLILPMARVGLRPFGQTSTQFMIVWQRNSRYGSSRLSSRSSVACVAAVGDEAIGLQQAGRADELVGVPPEARARGRAARAQDAFVQAVQLVALLGRLQALLLGRRLVVDEVRLDRVVLLEELRHVDDQVADHRQARQRLQHDRVLQRSSCW